VNVFFITIRMFRKLTEVSTYNVDVHTGMTHIDYNFAAPGATPSLTALERRSTSI